MFAIFLIPQISFFLPLVEAPVELYWGYIVLFYLTYERHNIPVLMSELTIFILQVK